tara:strand:+ start:2877 stop:4106 length:1230 start_codon:yes stop_codon:yes gene_type:complete
MASNKTSLEENINEFNRWMLFGDEELDLIFNKSSDNELVRNIALKRFIFLIPILGRGFIYSIYLFLKQFPSKTLNKSEVPNHILVESEAKHHHKNYFRFFPKGHDQNYLLIKCFKKDDFTKITYVPLIKILQNFFRNLIQVYKFLSIGMSSEVRIKVLRIIYSNIPIYSYFCALLSELKSMNKSVEIYHGGAGLVALAANMINIRTSLYSHGFINKIPSINIPRDDKIYVYSDEEVTYLSAILKNSEIKKYPSLELKQKEKKVILFLNPDSRMSEKELEHIIDLVQFFNTKDYEIFARRHPAEWGEIGRNLCSLLNIGFCDEEIEINQLLDLEKPEFTVSFLSTTICESLSAGIIPICISDNTKNKYDKLESVYPLERRSYFWNSESRLIKELIEEDNYLESLQTLKSR